MILYALGCANGHGFDGWFRSSEDFAVQSARRLLACPACGSEAVSKAVMAPAVARTDRRRCPAAAAAPEASESPASPPDAPAPVALLSDREKELRTMLRTMREQLVANADNVGDRFADTARAMHNEEVDRRSIYGRATAEEVKALHEEGVAFSPLPVLPDELS